MESFELLVMSGIAASSVSAIVAGIVQFTKLHTLVMRFLRQDDKMHEELNNRLISMSKRMGSLEKGVARLEGRLQ